jgi:hypothetical protein
VFPHERESALITVATKRSTAAKTAAKGMASYGHISTRLEYRASRQPLLDDPGRFAYAYGSEGRLHYVLPILSS